MFEDKVFETVTTYGRSSSNDLVSITQNKTPKKNELTFRLSKESLKKSGLTYKDKIAIQFADDGKICRLVKSAISGAATLSQQVKGNDMSAGLIRVVFKPGYPDFLKIESDNEQKTVIKTKYIHEENMIDFQKGQITFKLKRDGIELAKSEEVKDDQY